MKIQNYNPSEIEPKWQKIWEEQRIYQPDLDNTGKPFYNLMMFPYPSAEGLHVGNMYAFTGADIYGRFKRMQGFEVFEPIGLDGFGIHSENYAIKVGRHPKEQAKISQKNFYRQLRATGNGYDWSRTVETYNPDYYKWTQWIFIQLFKAGLAYRKKAAVNFCPKDLTVLADEQVIDGKCERCGSIVEKRDLSQWFFKITAYADRLLDGLSQIDWTEKVKIAQRNWIGRSEGALIEFKIQNSKFKIEVYTVFPETIFGVTYMVLAPEHPLVDKLITKDHLDEVREYAQKSKRKTEQERIAEGKEKTGVFTGSYCINTVNGQKVPIWVADYILAGYGTGAVMGVPGSDHRDFAFAQKYKLPIIRVIGKRMDDVSPIASKQDVLEEGVLVNSAAFSGLTAPVPARGKIKGFLEERAYGNRKNQYHLRDWLISRQRYWGAPIPMIHCEKCGWQPVPEKDLPVLLPDVKDWKPRSSLRSSGQAISPLASHPEFYNVACPECGGKANRETDVSDTFLDSSWYFLRYLATDRDDVPFPSEAFARGPAGSFPRPMSSPAVGGAAGTRRGASAPVTPGSITDRTQWLPVSMYIGGAEHSVLHLLYTRFLTMVFHDLDFVNFDEPFPRFFAHGLLIKEGAKMSKSKGNVVVPDEYIKKYGADSLRVYLMFLGPFAQGGDFYDSSILGIHRFLQRTNRLVIGWVEQSKSEGANNNLENNDGLINKKLHQTIKKTTEDIEHLRLNTAIAALMELLNTYYQHKNDLKYIHIEQFLLMLAPFAPHLSEELWQGLQEVRGSPAPVTPRFNSIHIQSWPKYDPRLLEEQEVTIVVSVNGKVRDSIKYHVLGIKYKDKIEQIVKEREKVKRHLADKIVKRVIYVEGKIINFVTE